MKKCVWILVCFTCISAVAEGQIREPAASENLKATATAASYPADGATDAPAGAPNVNAAELVRAVRESENWIHKVDSLLVRIESKWTRTPEGIAARQTRLKQECPCPEGNPNPSRDLKPTSIGTLEYAIDQGRLKFLEDSPGEFRAVRMWDGRQALSYEQHFAAGKEQYYLGPLPQSIGRGLFAAVSWLRSQPHSFWWDPIDVEEYLSYFGRREDFKLLERCNYRGVDCYLLEVRPRDLRGLISGQNPWDVGGEDRRLFGLIGEVRGLVAQSFRWYLGAEDHRLHGLIRLMNEKPYIEYWMLDYQQVHPGCWFPMIQGYEVYEKDDYGQPYLDCRRDLRVVEVSINESLPAGFFEVELKKGVKVMDERSGRLVTYTYEPAPPDLLGKALPKLAGVNIDFVPEQDKNKKLLVCFWDINQRPSRHVVRELAKRAEDLGQKDVIIAAVQTSQVAPDTLSAWVRKYDIPFPVGMVEGDGSQIRFAWGMKSLPWLVLADHRELVTANGFALFELEEELKRTGGG